MHSFFFLVRNTLWVASGLIIVAITILLLALIVPDSARHAEKPLTGPTMGGGAELFTSHR